MRQPYPYKVPVDAADVVRPLVLVDMPVPQNLRVHLANEHRINPDDGHGTENVISHLAAHMYGEFRGGSEHYHVRSEFA